MTQSQKISLIILRVSLGFLYLYAGFSKIIDPAWSAEGYLNSAKAGAGFYAWLASPSILPLTNLVNEWGLFLLGVSLILGLGVRISSLLGILLMVFYYIPLGFPYPDAHSLIADDHVVYSAALFVLYAAKAGRVWGLGQWSSATLALKDWFD